MLQHCWDSCGKLIDFVAHFWPEKRGSLYWCASITLCAHHDKRSSSCHILNCAHTEK